MTLLDFVATRSRVAFAGIVAGGVISGLSAAALVSVISHLLATDAVWTMSLAAWFIILCVLRLVSGIASHLLMVGVSQAAIRDLRLALCGAVLSTPEPELERIGTHRLFVTFNDDVVQIASAVIVLPYQMVNVVVVIGCLAYLGWLSLFLLAMLILCMGLGTLSYLLPVRWANSRLREGRKIQDVLADQFRAVVVGSKELKLNAARRQKLLTDFIMPTADQACRTQQIGIGAYGMAAHWGRLLFFLYVGLVLLVLPKIGVHGATLAASVLTVLYVMAPIEAVMNAIPTISVANIALRHIHELGLNAAAAIPAQLPEAPTAFQQVDLVGVSSHYADEGGHLSFKLGPIDLSVRPSEILFIVGGNGSGKTTLLKLLTGLYPLDQGAIRVDGRQVIFEENEWYREHFSAIYSEFHVLEAVVANGAADPVRSARSLICELGLEKRVRVNDAGKFSTTSALSNGERKRLALVAARMDDRPIMVFDEWAADQDPIWRKRFYESILPDLRGRGKAVIVVTHDDRYFDAADRIVKLEAGQLSERLDL